MIKAKKFLSRFIVLSIFIFSFSSCSEKAQKEKKDTPEVSAPSQIVPIAQAKDMYDNYTERRVPLIQRYEDSINRKRYDDKSGQEKKAAIDSDNAEDGKRFDVARYVSYDYKTIKQYLAFIEQEAKKANVEISGLRFYFSNYPDEPFFPDSKDSIVHPRQNSIMLSPTLKEGERDYLFYIGGSQAQAQAVLLSDSFGEIKGMGAALEGKNTSYASVLPSLSSSSSNININSSFYAHRSLTMNRGGSAPPPYNEK